MKNRDLFILARGLQSVMDMKGIKFAYAVAKNMNAIQTKLAYFQSIRLNNDPDFVKYEAERFRLAELHCEKMDGQPKIIEDKENYVPGGGHYVFSPASRALFDEGVAKAQETYKEAYDRHVKKEESFRALMDEPCDITFHKVNHKDLPNDLTAAQFAAIEPMITELTLVESAKKASESAPVC